MAITVRGQNPLLLETFTADAAIDQYNVVVQGTSDMHCNTTTTQNDANFLGVTNDAAAASGDPVPVVTVGTVTVKASQAISAGDQLICSATAGAVDPSSALASGTPVVIGRARTAATAAGDLILMKLA